MVNVPQATLDQMIANIPDKKQRELLGAVAGGKYKTKIQCLSDFCKGRTIGYISYGGQLVGDTETDENGEMLSGAYRLRHRFDGKIGLRCRCGNQSSLAEAEKGIIGGHIPTKQDLELIHQRLPKTMKQHKQVGGVEEVDGFRFTEF